jgi:hypothetical protein
MQARLGFAVAAHLEPEVLLVDEVLSVGDYSFRQKCHERMATFRNDGLPIVFISHNLQDIATLADRVLLLRPQLEPVLGGTAEILSLYRSPTRVSASDRAVLVRATLEDNRNQPLPTTINPGTSVTLDAVIAIKASMRRCCIGFEVVRHDGLVMFFGSPMFEGSRALDLQEKSTLRVQIAFRTNLLRGAYTVHLHLIDERRIWTPVQVRSVAEFAVHETTRVDGTAELEPQYSFDLPDIAWNRTEVAI